MNRKGNGDVCAIIILALVLAAFSFSVSGVVSKAANDVRQEAVNVGHAEWIADKNGKVSFKWLATTTLMLPRGELYPHDKKGVKNEY